MSTLAELATLDIAAATRPFNHTRQSLMGFPDCELVLTRNPLSRAPEPRLTCAQAAAAPLVFIPGAAQLLVLAPRRLDQMRHGNHAAVGRREECGQSRNVLDVAACQANRSRKRPKIHIAADGRFLGKGHLPHAPALRFLGKWKLDDGLHAAHKRFVNMVL